MPESTYIIIAVLAIALVLVVAFALWRSRRSRRLRDQFGPEYERTLEEAGKRGAAERELERRRHRVEKLTLRDLDPEERRDFGRRWRAVQVDFVDRPAEAVEAADKLITAVMVARGYPGGNFDQRVADASVDHAQLVPDYRLARQIAESSRRGEASTEELRQAVVCYRNLFQEMLGIEEVPVDTTVTDTGRELRR